MSVTSHLPTHQAAQVLRRVSDLGTRAAGRLDRAAEQARSAALDDAAFVDAAYRELLGREADAGGRAHFLAVLAAGGSRSDVRRALTSSPEYHSHQVAVAAIEAFHGGRVQWVKSLPRARRILDLGGTALGSPEGALIVMGYPYDFDDLAIVELPVEDRHELYHDQQVAGIRTTQGPVRYIFTSMTDLDEVPDGTVDMVVSAQTFEHITEAEGAVVLDHVRRVLAPGGVLALDTPNRAVTAIECAAGAAEWINPDHKIEYTHAQMLAAFDRAGLRVDLALGIGFMPRAVATRQWDVAELMEHPGLYADIERCYTLAYLARVAGDTAA